VRINKFGQRINVHTTHVIVCRCGHRNTISWPEGKSGFFKCQGGCGNIINVISKSGPSRSQGALRGVLVVALVIAGLIAIGTIAPKSQRKSLVINIPTLEPTAPIEPPRVEIPQPHFVPLDPKTFQVAPCRLSTEAECRRRAECRWQNGCREGRRLVQRRTIEQPVDEPRGEKKHNTVLPSPPTSTIAKSRRKNAIAPLTIESEAGTNYLVKLVNAADENDQIMVYVKGGESYSTKVPLGSYRIRAASGNTWYGRSELFGPDTEFFRLRGKKGSSIEETPLFQFKREGNKILGMTLSFKKVSYTNMEAGKDWQESILSHAHCANCSRRKFSSVRTPRRGDQTNDRRDNRKTCSRSQAIRPARAQTVEERSNTSPQELPLSTLPSREPPLATAPRQQQSTPKIKQIAKLTTAVILVAIAIVLCAYAFILTKQ
jgi:hypothetical protein